MITSFKLNKLNIYKSFPPFLCLYIIISIKNSEVGICSRISTKTISPTVCNPDTSMIKSNWKERSREQVAELMGKNLIYFTQQNEYATILCIEKTNRVTKATL